MGSWDIGLRHIVDVDGQLLAIDSAITNPTSLLERASRPANRNLWLVRAGERVLLDPRQALRLSRDEVLFFESSQRGTAILPLAA